MLLNWSRTGDGITIVTKRANADREVLRELWRTKFLGFTGKLPSNDCASDCRCAKALAKHGLKIREGNTEISRPPVLSIGQAYVDGGVDLEGRGLTLLAASVGGKDLLRNLRYMHLLGRHSDSPGEAEERLSTLLGIPEDRARDLLRQGINFRGLPDQDFDAESQWRPLIGDLMTTQGSKAQATRSYTAARDADKLVRRSNQLWDKLEG